MKNIPKEEICSFCDGTGQVVSSTTISRFKTCDCKMIPKEEPKQETFEVDSFIAGEEAFKEFRKGILEPNRFDFVCGFTEGVEWKKEQDKKFYSEEEVIDIAIKYFNHYYNISSRGRLLINHDLEWFEQFKKK